MYVCMDIMRARNTLSISSQFDYAVILQTDKLRYFLLREKTMPTTKKIAFFSLKYFLLQEMLFRRKYTERERDHAK